MIVGVLYVNTNCLQRKLNYPKLFRDTGTLRFLSPLRTILSRMLSGPTQAVLSLALAVLLISSAFPGEEVSARSVSYELNIPAEPLDSALQALALASHHKLFYRAELVAGKASKELKGTYTTEEAVTKLLEGSALSYEITASGVVLIRGQGDPPFSPAVVPSANDPNPASVSKEEPGKSSQDFRVAQVDQTSARPQVVGSDQDSEQKKQDGLSEIVVTGTHIRGVENLTIPRIVLDRAYIESTGFSTTTALIQSLPQNFALASQSGISVPGVTDATEAQGESINLRGIGEGTTLTLINGHRMALGFLGSAADISAIPLSAIDRVEVLTDGASAIYGSDAVGGVVNFILKHDYEGAETHLRRGWAEGVNEDRLSQSAGKSWESGNALASVEYYNRGLLRANDRDFVSEAQIGSLLPKDKDLSALLSGRQNLSDAVSIFGDALYTHRNSFNEAGILAFEHTSTTKNSQLSATGGFDWKTGGGWQTEASGGYADNKLDSLIDSIAGENSPYIPGQFRRNPVFTIGSAELKADGPLFPMPGGVVRAAVGADWRQENLDDSGTQATIAEHQTVRSAFAEMYVPIVGTANARSGIHRLDFSLAGRLDKYSDFSSSFDPRFGLMWEPVGGLRFRGSYGTSFLAPKLQEYFTAENVALALTLPDPGVPSGSSEQLILTGNNAAQLNAQKARSSSFGVDFDPVFAPGLHFGLNYYRIDYRDRIALPAGGDSSVILNNASSYSSLIVRNPTSEQLSAALAAAQLGQGLQAFDPNFNLIPPGAFDPRTINVIIDSRMRNLSITNTRGFDFAMQYALDIAGGKANFGLAGTNILNLTQRVTANSLPFDAVGTYENPPRWRARGSLAWQRWGWATNLFANYTNSYTDNRAVIPLPVASYTTVDVHTSFALEQKFGRGVWSGLAVSLSAQNVFNRNPPHTAVIQPFADLGFDPTNASPLGRLVAVELTKTW